MAGEVRVAIENLLKRGAVEKVIVQLAAFGAKPDALLRRFGEIKIAAIAVVEKDAVGAAVLQAGIERHGLIDWISSFGVAGRVGIPINKRTAALIEPSCFFSQSVEVFIETKLLRCRNESSGLRVKHHILQQTFRVVSHGLLVSIDKGMSFCVTEFDEQRRPVNQNFDLVSRDENGIIRLGQTPARGRPISFSDCPRMILCGNRLSEGRAYTNKIGRENCDLDLGFVLAVEDHGLFGFCETVDRADLFQFGNVLCATYSNKTQNAKKDCYEWFHISS